MTLWGWLLVGGVVWGGLTLAVVALLYASGESQEQADDTSRDSARGQ